MVTFASAIAKNTVRSEAAEAVEDEKSEKKVFAVLKF